METDPDGTQILMQLFILVLLTLVNAFFAGAEMAVVSVNKNRVKVLAEEGNKKALLIQSLFGGFYKVLVDDTGGNHMCGIFLKCIGCNRNIASVKSLAGTVSDSVFRNDFFFWSDNLINVF